ncbi:MAG: response regulator transcription factor, partial [Gemmatimonadaceae bacterium]
CVLPWCTRFNLSASPVRRMDCIRPATASIAVITSDASLAKSVADILADGQTQVVSPEARTRDGQASFLSRPDVIVLDRRDSPAIETQIRRLRRRWPTVDIVVVNAAGERELGALLDAGADDAVVIESSILPARLHACARRARTLNAGARIAVGDVVFDRENRRVWCAGHEVEMTRREQALLDCLFWYAPEPVGMQTLSDYVWGDEPVTSRRGLVEVYVGYVRRKLASSRAVAIKTVRGVGYRFEQLKTPGA